MMRSVALSHLLLLALVACDDNPPTSPGDTTTTTTAPATTTGSVSLRAAQLTQDGRTVDLVANGQVVAAGVPYERVSPYTSLPPGDYRLQFFPQGNRTEALVETVETLRSNETVTVALGGLSSFQIALVHDDLATRADRARVKLVNGVPDFPAAFDLAVRNGPLVFQDADYLQPTSYQELIPGIYDLVLRRAGSDEVVSGTTGHTFDRTASYTVFVVGTLRRNDIELFVVRDR